MNKILVFLFCLMPLIVSAQCFEERFDSGKKLYNQGKYEEAKERFQRCFDCDDKPSDKDAKLNEYIRLCDEKLSIRLSVSINNLSFDAEPKDNEYNVHVISNKEWSYSCDSDWCIISRNGNELLVSCKPNYNITIRECHIKVKALSKSVTIKVNQSGAKLELFLSKDTIVFDSIQSTKWVFVYTNADYWYYDSVPTWCDASKRQDTLFLTCHKNDSVINRYAKIVISSNKQKKNLNIIQKVGSGKIKTTTNHIIFDAIGGMDSLSIESNSPDFNWHVMGADWIAINKVQNNIIVKCEPNRLPVSRESAVVISVNNKETIINIEQKPHHSILDVSDNVIKFDGEGGSKIVTITSNNEWDYVNTTDWCQVFKYGTDLKISVLPNNKNNLKQGYIIIKTDNKSVYIAVFQKSKTQQNNFVSFESRPVWKPIYIDGQFYDRTPSRYAIDSINHEVRIGRRLFENIAFDKTKELKYNPGFRYLILTASKSNHVGAMTGFMGAKHIGMFNHFQIGIPVDDILKISDKKSSYLYALGPSVEIFNHLSLYGGLGPELFSQDSLYKMDITAEFGAMVYFRQIMLTFGYKMQKITLNESEDNGFFVGLGMYFDRYCIKSKNNVIRSRVSNSRRWWSINYIYAPNINGVMFGDLGKKSLRGYIKALYIDPDEKDIKQSLSYTGGLVFTPFPGFIDICTGIGVGAYINDGLDWKGSEAEAGFIVNIWRFPITIMFHEYILEKDSRHTSVEFGIGFHLGEFGNNKQPQYYYY